MLVFIESASDESVAGKGCLVTAERERTAGLCYTKLRVTFSPTSRARSVTRALCAAGSFIRDKPGRYAVYREDFPFRAELEYLGAYEYRTDGLVRALAGEIAAFRCAGSASAFVSLDRIGNEEREAIITLSGAFRRMEISADDRICLELEDLLRGIGVAPVKAQGYYTAADAAVLFAPPTRAVQFTPWCNVVNIRSSDGGWCGGRELIKARFSYPRRLSRLPEGYPKEIVAAYMYAVGLVGRGEISVIGAEFGKK